MILYHRYTNLKDGPPFDWRRTIWAKTPRKRVIGSNVLFARVKPEPKYIAILFSYIFLCTVRNAKGRSRLILSTARFTHQNPNDSKKPRLSALKSRGFFYTKATAPISSCLRVCASIFLATSISISNSSSEHPSKSRLNCAKVSLSATRFG